MKTVNLNGDNLNLRDVAEEACVLNGDADAARQAVAKWIDDHPDDWESLKEEAVQYVCTHLIGLVRHAINHRVKAAFIVHPKGQETTPRVSQDSKAAVRDSMTAYTFLMMTVAGKTLGECVRDDLLADATNDRLKGIGYVANALFKERVASRLRGNQKVKNVWKNNDELRELFLKSEQDARDQIGLSAPLAVAGN